MQKALRVLAVIAIVASLVQVFDLVVEVITPNESSPEYLASIAQAARIRWMVYWPSGLVFLVIGIFLRKQLVWLGNSLLIGGGYLMLLGNNGGLWASGHEAWRLVTSIVTLVVLSWLLRLEEQPLRVNDRENQS